MTPLRNRGWRRFQSHTHNGRGMGCNEQTYKGEKNWKHMYGRSEKILRAMQLGFDYPKVTTRQLLDREMNIDE